MLSYEYSHNTITSMINYSHKVRFVLYLTFFAIRFQKCEKEPHATTCLYESR